MRESKRRPWVKHTYKRGYTGSKRVDGSCRNHGSCNYCKNNRTHKVNRQGVEKPETDD